MRLALLVLAVLAVHADKDSEHLPTVCGRFLDFKYFIGKETEFDDFPWVVLLEYDTPWGKIPACGGVILASRYILTAGHCVANLGGNWNLTSVRVGEYDTSTSLDCISDGNEENTTSCMPASTSIKIDKTIVHEKYEWGVRGHDIALIKLAEDIAFTEYVQPICLPKREAEPQKFQVAGWGRLAGRKGSNLKYRSIVTLANGTACKEWYNHEKVTIADDQFCAGGKKKEEECVADSGGPLMGLEKMEDGSYKMAVFGLLTMDSRFCDLKGWPGVFTDVLSYRDWILRNTK